MTRVAEPDSTDVEAFFVSRKDIRFKLTHDQKPGQVGSGRVTAGRGSLSRDPGRTDPTSRAGQSPVGFRYYPLCYTYESVLPLLDDPSRNWKPWRDSNAHDLD